MNMKKFTMIDEECEYRLDCEISNHDLRKLLCIERDLLFYQNQYLDLIRCEKEGYEFNLFLDKDSWLELISIEKQKVEWKIRELKEKIKKEGGNK